MAPIARAVGEAVGGAVERAILASPELLAWLCTGYGIGLAVQGHADRALVAVAIGMVGGAALERGYHGR